MSLFVSSLARFYSGTYEPGLGLYLYSTTPLVKGVPCRFEQSSELTIELPLTYSLILKSVG
jgi:hypothetical protein